MKPRINGYPDGVTFNEVFVTEFYQGMIRINNINHVDENCYDISNN